MRVPESAMYLVVETFKYKVESTHYASSMQEAIKIANELLDARFKEIGHLHDEYGHTYDSRYKGGLKYGIGSGFDRGFHWNVADADNLHAWCRYEDRWDAYIVSL